MVCRQCGRENPDGTKFCPACGAAQQVVISPEIPEKKVNPKKPIYKKWWFWVIIAVIVIGALGSNKNVSKEDTAARPVEAVETETLVAEETETTPANEPEATPADEADNVVDLDTVISSIETVLKENYEDNYYIDYDEPMLNVSVWGEGISAGAVLAVNGDEDTKAQWDSIMDSMVSLCDAMQNVLNESGHSDVFAVVNVLNDANLDNTLATISFGSVLYDSVNGIDLLGAE